MYCKLDGESLNTYAKVGRVQPSTGRRNHRFPANVAAFQTAEHDRHLTQTNMKIDTEVAGLKTMLESHKLDTIKYLAGRFAVAADGVMQPLPAGGV